MNKISLKEMSCDVITKRVRRNINSDEKITDIIEKIKNGAEMGMGRIHLFESFCPSRPIYNEVLNDTILPIKEMLQSRADEHFTDCVVEVHWYSNQITFVAKWV